MKKNTRERILNACIKIIIENGINKLTLDLVSKEANISKGGLLHHFKSKNDLIESLLTYQILEFDNVLKHLSEDDLDPKGRNTRAYINSVNYSGQSTININNLEKLWSSLLLCFSEDPHSLKVLKNYYNTVQQKSENDEIDPVDATISRLAIDGLFLYELFNISPLSESMRQQVLDRLLKYTKNS